MPRAALVPAVPLTLGLLAAGLLGAPSPALADGEATTLTAAAPVLTAGEVATLSGTATPGAVVSLYGYSRPSTSYALITTAPAGADGAFTFTVRPTTNSRYYAGDGQDSPSVALGVRKAVHLDPVQVEGDRLTVAGRLLPRTSTPVDVVFTRDGVRTVESTALATARGFRQAFTSPRRGVFQVTVAAPATADNLAGESAAQQVLVRPAQAARASAG